MVSKSSIVSLDGFSLTGAVSSHTLIQDGKHFFFAWGWGSTRGTDLFIEQVNWGQNSSMRAS